MQAKGWIMLRILLNRYHSKKPEQVLKSLSEQEVKAVLGQETTSNRVEDSLIHPINFIEKMHYSWLIPEIQKFPHSLQGSLLSALSTSQTAKLKPYFKEAQIPNNPISEPVKAFIIHTLYSRIKHEEVLPISYLPPSPLSPLTNLHKAQLIELIDLLGILDLVDEVRHIIDKGKLTKLHLCLTDKQRKFLHVCLHQKGRLAGAPIKISAWNGERKQMHSLIHKRGMLRLAKALCGQHPDLLWHLSHTLDAGRGAILSGYYSQQVSPGITPILLQQVQNTMNFLNIKSVS